jgi:sialic acid synthase
MNHPTPIFINNTNISNDSLTYFIAEIGINHNGSIELAKKLIQSAKDSGANAVKFQKRNINEIFTENARKREYNSIHSYGKTYEEHKEALEFDESQYQELKEFSDEIEIDFFASGMDKTSVDILEKLNVSCYKIGSPDIRDFPLLEYTARKGKPILLSTGMSDIDLVVDAYNHIKQFNNNIILMQCTSVYPLKSENVNLNVISKYKELFPEAIIGYSGHESGTSISLAAITLGAKVIERHFTLDKTMKGNDHQASLEPNEFKYMVNQSREIEKALGSFNKNIQLCEEPVITKTAKRIVANKNINSNEIITDDMICCKVDTKPGIYGTEYYNIIGKKLNKFIKCDTSINYNDLL